MAAGLRASSALAPAVGCSTTWTTLQRALYSTAPPAEPAPAPAKPKEGDYSLVMAQAAQLATECASAPLPPGEGGVTFGVPLETFKRKVRYAARRAIAAVLGAVQGPGGCCCALAAVRAGARRDLGCLEGKPWRVVGIDGMVLHVTVLVLHVTGMRHGNVPQQ